MDQIKQSLVQSTLQSTPPSKSCRLDITHDFTLHTLVNHIQTKKTHRKRLTQKDPHKKNHKKTHTKRITEKRLTQKDSHKKTHTKRITEKRLTQKDSHKKTHTKRITEKRLTQKDSHKKTHTKRITEIDSPKKYSISDEMDRMNVFREWV